MAIQPLLVQEQTKFLCDPGHYPNPAAEMCDT